MPILTPSEWFATEYLGHANAFDGDMSKPLAGVTQLDVFTPLQEQHTVTRDALARGVHRDRIRLCGIYMDAAGFTKEESVEEVFVSDVATGRRGLTCILRKAEMCNCGCRGWCTVWPAHEALRHEFAGAAAGVLHSHYSDRSHFEPGCRADRRGRGMGIHVALVEFRADWPGFAAPMGFRMSRRKTCPCLVCTVTSDTMACTDGITLDEGPWNDFDDNAYRIEVIRCLVEVTIATEADRSAVMRAPLEYDRRTNRNRFLGRKVNANVMLSTGQLLCHDRLHPPHELRDVDDFNDH